MPKPACIPCQRFFRVKRNGFVLAENMPAGYGAQPGTAVPERWKPYKVWQCDLWQCEGCGAEIAVGYGPHPWAEHHEPGFAAVHQRREAEINDC